MSLARPKEHCRSALAHIAIVNAFALLRLNKALQHLDTLRAPVPRHNPLGVRGPHLVQQHNILQS